MDTHLIIGPSYPETYDLFRLPFMYQEIEHPSLFHGIVRPSKPASHEEVHQEYVRRTKGGPIFHFCGVPAAFGVYAFQHYETVCKVLRQYPNGTRVYIEGLEGVRPGNPEYFDVVVIRDMIASLGKRS